MSRQARSLAFTAGIVALATLWCAPLPAQIWLDWQEVTSTNIVADPAVGANDIEEKDFAAADLDLDGDIDLICVRKLPFTTFGNRRNVIFRNTLGVLTDVTATLAPGMMTPDNARDVAIGDVNGDPWPDFVIANAGNAGSNGQQPRIFINLGNDGGGNWLGFAEEASRLPFLLSPTGNEPNFCAVSMGDVTGDGADDIYLVDYNNDLEDKLLVNDGIGNFTDQTATLPASFVPSAFGTAGEIADMNGDAWPEIVKISNGDLRVAYNNGSGGFTVWQSPSTSAPYHFDTGDLDGDNKRDIFVVQDPQDQWLKNNSGVGAAPIAWTGVPVGASPLTTGFGGNAHIHDLDGDGDNDVIVADTDTDVPGCSRRMAFLRNDGGSPPSIADPYPSNQWTIAHHLGVYDVSVADFNGDGALDLFVGHCNGNDLYFQTSNIPGVVPPSGFTCPQVGLGVQLAWTNGEAYNQIEVRRNGTLIAALPGTATSYSDPAPGTGIHSYSLVAAILHDAAAPVSCSVAVSTVNPVLNLACDQVDTDVQLSWTNQAPVAGGSYSGIRVVRSGVDVALLPGSATSFLDLAPPLGLTGYQVIAEAGAESSAAAICSLAVLPTNLTDLVIGFTADDAGATDSATAIANALADNGIFALVLDVPNLAEVATLGYVLADFDRIWLELGMFPNNKNIPAVEGTLLANYVSGGGRLYVSGGDFFCFDASTALHALTGIDIAACADGGATVIDVTGIVSASCGLESFSATAVPYAGEASFVDQLQPLTTGSAILRMQGATTNCGVLNQLPGGGAVISQSVEMGGIGVAHDKQDLVERYISCFGGSTGPVAPIAQFSGTPLGGQAPLEVSFTDLSTGTVDSWLWSFGDTGTSTIPNPTHTYTAAGSYAVTLTVTGPVGSDSETKTAYISVTPGAPVASFTAVPTSGDAPLQVQFTDTSSGVVTGRTWVFGDGGFSNLAAPSHTYTAAGTYTVSLTVSGPGGSDNETMVGLITVDEPAGPGFRRGDVNQDGSVNIADAVGTLSYLFSAGSPGNCHDAMDMGDNGAVDISDAIYLLGFLFSSGPAPLAPFGACGEDPTADALPCGAPACP